MYESSFEERKLKELTQSLSILSAFGTMESETDV